MNHKDCPPDEGEKSKRVWPRYHAYVASMKNNGEYMKTKIDHINMGSSQQTRLQAESGEL